MLVLSRKTDERVDLVNDSNVPLVIQPGERVAAVVISYVRGNRVGLGFEAPPSISIVRAELKQTDSKADALVRKAD